MTDREVMQQALEALEVLSKLGNGGTDGNSVGNTIAQEAREHLFTALAQPEQVVDCPRCGHVCSQREWVGLTPEEILDLFDRNNVYGSKWIEFARAVEAKLKAKND